ncbi:MAG: AarF/ABC1/UbiB kinase family protein, partial [Myxococcota bacterium]|nr:AarF/ABC1/UbiB kinase family protein [Myxococcota bacterium]
MKIGTRIRRTVKVGWTAASIWGMYKIPDWTRRLLGSEVSEAELARTHRRAASRILDLALDLRGVVIKMCQAIATRADIFPKEFIDLLKQCHDAVPPKPFEAVRKVVETELGSPLDAVFTTFEETAIASASLAQVHRARLLDGREVAVKVQYPDIEDIIHTDLANMSRVCRVYEFFDPQPLPLLPLVTELTRHLAMELDFVREGECADRVRELFADDPLVKVPKIHREWTTSRVLTMELVGGMKITEREAIQEAQLVPAEVL